MIEENRILQKMANVIRLQNLWRIEIKTGQIQIWTSPGKKIGRELKELEQLTNGVFHQIKPAKKLIIARLKQQDKMIGRIEIQYEYGIALVEVIISSDRTFIA